MILKTVRAAFGVVLAIGGISIVAGCSLWRSIEDRGSKPVPMQRCTTKS